MHDKYYKTPSGISAAVLLAASALWGIRPAAANSQPRLFTIEAQDLGSALKAFALQSQREIFFAPDLTRGKRTQGVRGKLDDLAALSRILNGTGLSYTLTESDAILLKGKTAATEPQPIAPEPAPTAPAAQAGAHPAHLRLAQAQLPANGDTAAGEVETRGIPEVHVQGSRTLNMDIERTRDDPQPYVIFDRDTLERAGVASLEQFLQQRLTMNTATVNTGINIATSQVNLRGLGANQTLILVDGHRVASPTLSGIGTGVFGQPDLTGIPLAAIERIEILPTTASGIYGGSATGGVINIVMRRDYSGIETKLTYDNTFDSDSATRKFDLTGGFAFNEGRTTLLVTGNYADANELRADDRDLMQRGRAKIRDNNPTFFYTANYPPLGYTTNIRSANGSKLVLKTGTVVNLDSPYAYVPAGYSGPASDNGAAFLNTAGDFNYDLARGIQTGSGGQAIYTRPTVSAGSLTLRHQFDSGLQLFADLTASDTRNRYPADSFTINYQISNTVAANPFTTPIRVTVPYSDNGSDRATTSKNRRAVLGLMQRLPRGWQLGLDFTRDRSSVEYFAGLGTTSALSTAITTGALDVLRDTNAYPLDISSYETPIGYTQPFLARMQNASARVSGPVMKLPGGPVTVSALLEQRRESAPDMFYFTTAFLTYYPERSQRARSGYLELRAPLFSALNGRPGLRELELQLALRQDRYVSESGEQKIIIGATSVPSPLPAVLRARNELKSTDPTVALRWKPVEDLVLRASYGTGFLPPALSQLIRTISPIPSTTGVDPLRGNTPAGPYTYIIGGNPDLQPEHSESWSAGAIFTPRILPALRVSLDYTRIEKTDNIATHPGGVQGLINDAALFPGRVVRGDKLTDDPASWAGRITQVDFSLLNLARAELDAWDLQLEWTGTTGRFGRFDVYALGTWQPSYDTQTLASQPVIGNVGVTSGNPLKFKSNAGVNWSYGAWRAGWNVRYFHSYLTATAAATIANQGQGGRVGSQTYHDLFVSHVFNHLRMLSGAEMQLGIGNVFNTRPPFDASSSYYYSGFADPRLANYSLSIKYGF